MPRVLAVDPQNPEPSVIAEAARVFERGGLVAFPTETVYGLGARGLHAAEVLRIFSAKGRPTGHPLILHADGDAMASTLASTWSSEASSLAHAFWPGPLTLVVPRAAHVPLEVTGGLDSVGIRCPSHPVARALVTAVGEPLAAPSANAHMHVSPTSAEHVVRSLGDRVDLVLDGGSTDFGIESTVVDLAGWTPRVLRPGAVSLERLRALVPSIVYQDLTVTDDVARASPGLASKHYAPRAKVRLALDASEVTSAVRDASAGGPVCAIVWSDETRSALEHAATHEKLAVIVMLLPADADGYARGLFAALHAVEASGAASVVIERVPDSPEWWAVADRLRRAAHEGGG
ncbi:hypothetical protein AKJ09_11390 [Labilithrix luteola]|uniref:Threonylcarbamoyl-AMP synthase n=1 Tax=Labilithrix luteola TaxID=1391654 RepID=A0A0K1QGF7_9BACT|nr:L-threonylcarbamoyladenylate synthase [Labilithrix luteola]AKV04727.1 hypothetical protein AKJ09_11390 [Labilithrix luteola]